MAKNFLDQIKTAVKDSGSSKKDILCLTNARK